LPGKAARQRLLESGCECDGKHGEIGDSRATADLLAEAQNPNGMSESGVLSRPSASRLGAFAW